MELTRPKIESRDPIFFTGTRSRSRVSGNDRLFPRGSEFGPNLEIPAGPAIQLRPGPGQRSRWTGRGPTGWRARGRNRRQLENRSHVVPKTEFEDGSDRTWIFTHKMIILAQFILKVGHPGITCEQPISCARYAWLHSSTWGALVGGLNSVQIRHFWNRTVKQTSCTIDLARNGNSGCAN